ncbi:hypothetical protein RDABS01_032619 [Bienertia sinuspersici]
MEENGCAPDSCTFNTIIRGFLDGKDIRRALQFVSIIRSKGFVAENHTISSMIGLLRDPSVSDADKVGAKVFPSLALLCKQDGTPILNLL